ncbi:MAG: HNH endonuclease [Melioribacteraceae bacterium]
MSFSKEISEMALLLSGRCCCICHKFCGNKIELHHIIPESEGGQDTFENCIPLCFDCHAEVGNYNDKHPKGKKYSTSELKKHRDAWYSNVKSLNSSETNPSSTINQSVSGKNNVVAGGDITYTQKFTKRNEVIPDAGGRHITDNEAFEIKEKVKKYSELMKEAGLDPNPAKLWSRLYKHFQVASYREIPFGCADEAMKIIIIETAKARPKVRRRNPEAWRKQYYNAIWAEVNQLGMLKEEIYDFAYANMLLKKRITSLTELTQKQLQELDRKLKARLKG